jgi:hypothetical protein
VEGLKASANEKGVEMALSLSKGHQSIFIIQGKQ